MEPKEIPAGQQESAGLNGWGAGALVKGTGCVLPSSFTTTQQLNCLFIFSIPSSQSQQLRLSLNR